MYGRDGTLRSLHGPAILAIHSPIRFVIARALVAGIGARTDATRWFHTTGRAGGDQGTER
jgi:hypothetical protein